MKKLYYLFVVALLVIVSCNKDEISDVITSKNSAIIASIEQSASKTRLGIANDNTLSWVAGDAFTFFVEDDTYVYEYNSETGTFGPEVGGVTLPENANVSMVSYPSVDGNRYEDDVLSVTLPSVLDFSQTTDENQIKTPMWGTFSNASVSFKHLAGILRVNLNNLPEGYNQMTIVASNPIAGAFEADFSESGSDVCLEPVAGGNLHNTVKVKFMPVQASGTNKTLYLPLPVGTYESINLSVQKVNGEAVGETKVLADWTNKTVQRAYIYTANATYKEATNVEDANDILEDLTDENKNIHVVVGEIEDSAPAVSVPVVEGSTVVMDFSDVDNDVITIAQSSVGTPGESVQNLFVNVDNTSTSTMTVNTPTATVEVGSGKFNTFTATTATNTLIIKAGVTIGKLIIEGGNVIIENGAEIDEIENNAEGNIISKKVANLNELKAALTAGDNIVLGNDILGLTELLKISEPLVIDGNGYKMTSSAQKVFEVYADATIKNITIEGASRCVDTRTAVNLTLDNVTLIADKTTYGNPQPLTIGGSTNGTVVTINNSTISAADKGYAIITFVKTTLTATASNIGGYNALYVKPGSADSQFNFVNSTLHGSTGSNDVDGNSFAVLALRDNNVEATVDADSKIIATGNYCYAVGIGSTFEGETGPYTGVNAIINGTVEGKLLYNISFDDNNVKFKECYKDALNEAGYITAEPADGMVKVTARAAAMIGDELYADLEDAIEAATAGDEVVVKKSIALSETLIIEKAITLDLNGYTISPAEDFKYFDGDEEFLCLMLVNGKLSSDNVVVTIKNGTIEGTTDKAKTTLYAEGGYNFGGTLYGEKLQNLTLNLENVEVKNTRTDGIGAAMVFAGGTCNLDDKTKIITSGTYGTIECSASGVLNVKGATVTHTDSKSGSSVGFTLGAAYGATINVNSGTVSSDRHCLYALPSGGTINVSGGAFTGSLVEHKDGNKVIEIYISGGTFSVDPTEYLVEGKQATQNGSTWTVN